MRTLLFLSFLLTSGAMAQKIEVPPHGMTCESSGGYILDIYPESTSLLRLQFNLVDPKGIIIDDNLHQFFYLPLNILTGDDGVVSFSIQGIEEESLKNTHVFYENDVLDLVLVFDNCDVI
ncbi:hypothetical protein N9N67_02065 [Bacteriovoracaceae bacterium]|nr:hypothetical protein [Bacteriovoracaceae bacterium]